MPPSETRKSSESISPPDRSRAFPFFPVLLILLLLGFALFGEKGILRALQDKRHRDSLQQEIDRLEEANAALRREIEALRADRRTIEAIAREELGMVREDEVIYQFPSDSSRKADSGDNLRRSGGRAGGGTSSDRP